MKNESGFLVQKPAIEVNLTLRYLFSCSLSQVSSTKTTWELGKQPPFRTSLSICSNLKWFSHSLLLSAPPLQMKINDQDLGNWKKVKISNVIILFFRVTILSWIRFVRFPDIGTCNRQLNWQLISHFLTQKLPTVLQLELVELQFFTHLAASLWV
jgi:hypothetical protein